MAERSGTFRIIASGRWTSNFNRIHVVFKPWKGVRLLESIQLWAMALHSKVPSMPVRTSMQRTDTITQLLSVPALKFGAEPEKNWSLKWQSSRSLSGLLIGQQIYADLPKNFLLRSIFLSSVSNTPLPNTLSFS